MHTLGNTDLKYDNFDFGRNFLFSLNLLFINSRELSDKYYFKDLKTLTIERFRPTVCVVVYG